MSTLPNHDAEQAFRQARISLIKSHAWWGALALRFSPDFSRTDIKISATDGVRIFINAADFVKRSLHERRTIIVHEVLHPAFGDLWRCGTRDFMVWNIAADIRIHNLQVGEGFTLLPDVEANLKVYLNTLGFQRREDFIGKTTEEVYDLLIQAGANKPQSGQGKGKSDGGQSLGGGCGCCQFRGDQQGEGADKGDSGDQESDGGGISDSQLEREWRQATLEAAIRAGSQSGALKELIEAAGKARVKWSDYLNEFLNRGLNGDSQWLPVNRRFIHGDVYFPSTTTIEVGEVVAIVDTSGSMSSVELARAFGELSEFKRMYACQLHVIQADAAVCDYKEYDRSEELPDKFPTHGRGGTSFNPAFKYIAEKGIQPRLIVYLTDGEGSCTVQPPPYPVLWVQVPWVYGGRLSYANFKPPFGEHIKVE